MYGDRYGLPRAAGVATVFQSAPGQLAGRIPTPAPHHQPPPRFQSAPGQLAGRIGPATIEQLQTILFQSAPGQLAGRIAREKGPEYTPGKFQSAPGQLAGRILKAAVANSDHYEKTPVAQALYDSARAAIDKAEGVAQ